MRQLKFHEQKLLKKHDFINYKEDNDHREIKVMRRYHVENRQDYDKYNRLCGNIRKLAHEISLLDPRDPFRSQHERLLLEKLYAMGVLRDQIKLSDVENKVTVSAFCRRRLPVVMQRVKMAETVSMATKFIEQGHVRVGPHVVTDPAFLVTRSMEDFVTWVDTSKMKRHIATYKDTVRKLMIRLFAIFYIPLYCFDLILRLLLALWISCSKSVKIVH